MCAAAGRRADPQPTGRKPAPPGLVREPGDACSCDGGDGSSGTLGTQGGGRSRSRRRWGTEHDDRRRLALLCPWPAARGRGVTVSLGTRRACGMQICGSERTPRDQVRVAAALTFRPWPSRSSATAARNAARPRALRISTASAPALVGGFGVVGRTDGRSRRGGDGWRVRRFPPVRTGFRCRRAAPLGLDVADLGLGHRLHSRRATGRGSLGSTPRLSEEETRTTKRRRPTGLVTGGGLRRSRMLRRGGVVPGVPEARHRRHDVGRVGAADDPHPDWHGARHEAPGAVDHDTR